MSEIILFKQEVYAECWSRFQTFCAVERKKSVWRQLRRIKPLFSPKLKASRKSFHRG